MPSVLSHCRAESGIRPSSLVYAPPPSLSHLTQARVHPAHKDNRQTSEAHMQNDHQCLQELPFRCDGAPSQHPAGATPAGQHLLQGSPLAVLPALVTPPSSACPLSSQAPPAIPPFPYPHNAPKLCAGPYVNRNHQPHPPAPLMATTGYDAYCL